MLEILTPQAIDWRINGPLITHYCSRLATFAFIILGVVLGSVPIENCAAIKDAIGVFFVISHVSTSLLFLHRVRAVFFRERLIVAFFVILWLAVVGTSIVVPITVTVGYMDEMKFCNLEFETHFPPLIVLWTASVFYGLVFLCTSWRLVKNMNMMSDDESKRALWWMRIKSIFRGDNLPRVTNEIVKGGRKYYLHTMALDILVVSVVSDGFSNFSYAGIMFTMIYIEVAFKNTFACRIFRDTLLEILQGDQMGRTDVAVDSRSIRFAPYSMPVVVTDDIVIEESFASGEEGWRDESERNTLNPIVMKSRSSGSAEDDTVYNV
ncbi:hypothetical protein EIP91_004830 [Steccherinum ochraceum]|uniref:Uncharacterized protein n=1 Tax=Steccherinum ochraceum TaxID=92696 RepID=A0A4R0RN79_9APHY|nr:hypothetical protein EIP91_004830 [Steccherinum ochraceum]